MSTYFRWLREETNEVVRVKDTTIHHTFPQPLCKRSSWCNNRDPITILEINKRYSNDHLTCPTVPGLFTGRIIYEIPFSKSTRGWCIFQLHLMYWYNWLNNDIPFVHRILYDISNPTISHEEGFSFHHHHTNPIITCRGQVDIRELWSTRLTMRWWADPTLSSSSDRPWWLPEVAEHKDSAAALRNYASCNQVTINLYRRPSSRLLLAPFIAHNNAMNNNSNKAYQKLSFNLWYSTRCCATNHLHCQME